MLRLRLLVEALVMTAAIFLPGCDTGGMSTAENRAHFYFVSPDDGETVDVHDSLSAGVFVAKSALDIDLILTIELPDARTFSKVVMATAMDTVRFSVSAPFLEIPPDPGGRHHEYPVRISVKGVDGNGDLITDSREVTARVFREFFRIEVGMEWEFDYTYSHSYPAPPPDCGRRGQWRDEVGTLTWTVMETMDAADCPECARGAREFKVTETVQGVFTENIPGEHCEGAFARGWSPLTDFTYEREILLRQSGPTLTVQPEAPLSWDNIVYFGYRNWGEVDLPLETSELSDSLFVSQFIGGGALPGTSNWTLKEGIGPTKVLLKTQLGTRGSAFRLITLIDFIGPGI